MFWCDRQVPFGVKHYWNYRHLVVSELQCTEDFRYKEGFYYWHLGMMLPCVVHIFIAPFPCNAGNWCTAVLQSCTTGSSMRLVLSPLDLCHAFLCIGLMLFGDGKRVDKKHICLEALKARTMKYVELKHCLFMSSWLGIFTSSFPALFSWQHFYSSLLCRRGLVCSNSSPGGIAKASMSEHVSAWVLRRARLSAGYLSGSGIYCLSSLLDQFIASSEQACLLEAQVADWPSFVFPWLAERKHLI